MQISILCAISHLLFLHTSVSQAAVIERLEASINSQVILLSDVESFKATRGLRAQLDPLFAGTPVANNAESSSSTDIVKFLVDEKIITQQYPSNDTEVEQEINSILANNKIDRSTLKSTLRGQGYDYDSYFELIRVSTSKRNLIDRDIRTKVTISEEDIKNYFYNHYAKNSKAPRTYDLKIITVSPKNYKSPSAAKSYAQQALDAIQGGEAFDDVAKRVSDDPSGQNGGELPPLQEDQMSPAIRNAVHGLAVGGLSKVVGEASTQFMIVKLVDIRSAEDARYNQTKEEIRNQLVAAEYQHQISLWLERQRQGAFIHLAGEEPNQGSFK